MLWAYVVGEDEWVHLDSFPVESDGSMTYYMTKDKTDGVTGTAYALSTEKPSAEDTRPLRMLWATPSASTSLMV